MDQIHFFRTYLSNRYQRVRFGDLLSWSANCLASFVSYLHLWYLQGICWLKCSILRRWYPASALFWPNRARTNCTYTYEGLEASTLSPGSTNLKLIGTKGTVLQKNYWNEDKKCGIYVPKMCLGLHIDTSLRFRDHVCKLLQKSYATMTVLYANNPILNFKVRKKLRESLVLPIFHYCNIIFYHCLDVVTKNRLQMVQNTCCRFVFGLRKYDRISSKIKYLHSLNMCHTVKLHFLMFVIRLLRSDSPVYLKGKLIFRSDIHDRHLRHRDQLTMPLHHSAIFQRSFTF